MPKGVENLKLQIDIFALEPKKGKKQTKTKHMQKVADKKILIGRRDIMDYFISSANTHA